MSFTRFRQSLCFTFFLQSPFFTFVGSKVGVVVTALASHLCDPGSVPVVGTWVEFVVGSVLAPRGFFRVLQIFSLHKNQHFQIPIQPGRQVFTHDAWSSHYDAKFDLPFFLLQMLDTYSWMYPFSNLHAICIVWPVSLFPFTWFLQDLGHQIYMLFTGYRTAPNFSFTCSLHVLFKKFTGNLQRRYCKFVPQNLHVIYMAL